MVKKDDTAIQTKLAQLDQLVEWFDGDEFQLEQASIKLKQAATLAKDIEHDLQLVTNDIQQIKQSFASESGS
jgi:exonuclease VII small subunit